jgi:poly-gamma-glutamate capsule biosynthesis protein CapA/YwtB (metallophosphatase superfamily)
MKFTAVGDFLIQEVYKTPYDGFNTLQDFILRGDARFFNLETTLNKEGTCCASQFSGGSYLRVDPTALDTVKSYGCNLITTANNHAFDFSYDGFLSTLACLEQSGLTFAGVGRDLPSAAKPAYLQTENGTVALIAVTASLNPTAIAGNPSKVYAGRPGVNGLRQSEVIEVTADQMATLEDIAAKTGVNHEADIDRKDGYLPELPAGVFEFAGLKLETADKPGRRVDVNKTDYARIMASIDEAKGKADYVLISLHNHSLDGEKENVPAFLEKFCRDCIDRGAHAVIGHGPHLVRGIEIYKNRPIFHSLGDFVLQLNSTPSAPAEYYEKNGVPVDAGMKELLWTRSKGGKRGLMYDRKMFETFIPYWEMENGKLTRLELLPVELGFDAEEARRGIPQPARDLSFIDRLADISAVYGTKMHIENGKVIVDL